MVLPRLFSGAFMSEEKAKPNRKALEPHFFEASRAVNPWLHRPAAGTAFAELLNPEYWANIAWKLNRDGRDHIEVQPADGTYWAMLLVTDVGPFTAKVTPLLHVEIGARAGAMTAAIPTGYDIAHRGKNGWCVVRKSDKATLKEGVDSQQAAALWLDGHLKTFAQG